MAVNIILSMCQHFAFQLSFLFLDCLEVTVDNAVVNFTMGTTFLALADVSCKAGYLMAGTGRTKCNESEKSSADTRYILIGEHIYSR